MYVFVYDVCVWRAQELVAIMWGCFFFGHGAILVFGAICPLSGEDCGGLCPCTMG